MQISLAKNLFCETKMTNALRINPILCNLICDTLNCSPLVVIEQVEKWANQCQQCPPNVTHQPGGCYNKGKSIPIENKVWVYRGYYPQTDIFFKLVVIDTFNNIFVKFTFPRLVRKSECIDISVEDIMELSEALLVDRPSSFQVPKPKCMAPKGMPLLNRK